MYRLYFDLSYKKKSNLTNYNSHYYEIKELNLIMFLFLFEASYILGYIYRAYVVHI